MTIMEPVVYRRDVVIADLTHVVSYNLKMMENFVDRVGTSSAAEQREVVSKLDSRLHSIALRKVWHMQ